MTARTGLSRIWPHFWFKCLGTSAFMTLFFTAYIHLLKNPAGAVTTMPVTMIDRWIPFQPWSVAIYVSLWVYVSLPPAFMLTREDVAGFGLRACFLCLLGLTIFALWPTAVPPANIDWAAYPGMAVLKGVDAAGNACPSLHVATAVFSGMWLHWMAPYLGMGPGMRLGNALWCTAIAYSTLATRQHVAIDVCSGALLGAAVAWSTRPRVLLRA